MRQIGLGMECFEAVMPGGIWLDGKRHRKALLRPLNGGDEEHLHKQGRLLTPARRSIEILGRSLRRLGPVSPVSLELVRTLTVGDRDALVLRLRQATFGDRIQSSVTCSNSACGEKMDLDLRVSDLLLPPYDAPRETHEREFPSDRGPVTVRFRLLTVGDLESVGELATANPESATKTLLGRLLLDANPDGSTSQASEIPSEVLECLSAELASLDPQAEIRLQVKCPECGSESDLLLDPSEYFLSELGASRNSLYYEIHLLALNYHWSEREILNLSRNKRRRYLSLLGEPAQNVS